jgi:2,3-bisphosphoglycerate-dependent phosphoglycerate mutase
MSRLVLVRHGKSPWNNLGLWTGLTDVDLVEEGLEEARKAGELLRDHDFHLAFTSELKRTHQTLGEIFKILNLEIPQRIHPALNERDYGIHTGKNKWQVKEEIGEEAFQAIRRGWDTSIEGGETLKDVYQRVVPFYREAVLPFFEQDKNILIVAHGNSLRALMKHLELIDDNAISEVEIGTGQAVCYQLDKVGGIINKELHS